MALQLERSRLAVRRPIRQFFATVSLCLGAAAGAVEAGEFVYVNLAGDHWQCFRVTSFDNGPGGVPYAWLVSAGEPPSYVSHLPVSALHRACPSAAAASRPR